MLYRMNTTEATAAVPRIVDAHSLLHMRASKAAKACDAADVVDGHAVLQNPTLRVAATAYGVSVGHVARARRLTPEQRQAVRKKQRPLLVKTKRPAPPVPSPESDEDLLVALIMRVGVDRVLEVAAAIEHRFT